MRLALELGAKMACLHVGECDQVTGGGGRVDELLEARHDRRAQAVTQELTLDRARPFDRVVRRATPRCLRAAGPRRPLALPQAHHVPALPFAEPSWLRKKECFEMQAYAEVAAMVNPSVSGFTQPGTLEASQEQC
jgi:hypothetical protein